MKNAKAKTAYAFKKNYLAPFGNRHVRFSGPGFECMYLEKIAN